MHETCPHCGAVIIGDSSNIGRLYREHIERMHNQGYRRSDSWNKCSACNGTGKDPWGLLCMRCKGSGVE